MQQAVSRRVTGIWPTALSLCLASVFAPGLADARPAQKGPKIVTVGDRENYFQGSYTAYASPWSIFFDKTLVRGKHYLDTIAINPATFPNGTLIRSRWPVDRPMKTGVWGYHALSYGNYDGGNPKIPIASKKVVDIAQLSQTFNYSFRHSPNFNLLTEFYLTSKQGDSQAKVFEVGFFLYTPRWNFHDLLRKARIGAYTDSASRRWIILQEGTFIMFVPEHGAAIMEGTIDVREFLNRLIEYKVITGQEWFNGIAFGMEPIKGAGRTDLLIERWRVDYK